MDLVGLGLPSPSPAWRPPGPLLPLPLRPRPRLLLSSRDESPLVESHLRTISGAMKAGVPPSVVQWPSTAAALPLARGLEEADDRSL